MQYYVRLEAIVAILYYSYTSLYEVHTTQKQITLNESILLALIGANIV